MHANALLLVIGGVIKLQLGIYASLQLWLKIYFYLKKAFLRKQLHFSNKM